MKVDIRDTAALETLLPGDVAAYLRSREWRQLHRSARGSIWQPEGREDAEVELPADRALADFPARMADVLQVLSAIEGRSQLEIFTDLRETGYDVIRLRAAGAATGETGALPIDAGVQLISHGRDMLMAAASATAERRGFFPTRKPAAAVDYMDRVRLGHSEVGSYVATLLSPVAPALRGGPQQDLDLEEPFDRRVTVTLAQALGALRAAANEAAVTGAFERFEAVVDQGVTANLCTAVAGMSEGLPDGSDLTVSIAWSQVRPVEPQAPHRTRFGPDVAPIIREAARIIKATTPIDDYQVLGFVVRLDQRPDAVLGRIAVLTIGADDSTRTINMNLDGDAYGIAIRAHGDRVPISVVGRLTRVGHLFHLMDPRDFHVVQPEEGDEAA